MSNETAIVVASGDNVTLFNTRLTKRLQTLLATGLFGASLDEVVERVCCLYLMDYEFEHRLMEEPE